MGPAGRGSVGVQRQPGGISEVISDSKNQVSVERNNRSDAGASKLDRHVLPHLLHTLFR